MGKIIFIIVSIVFLIQILRLEDEKKLIWLFAAILFFPQQILIVETPLQLSILNLLVFVLSIQIFFDERFKQCFSEFPIKKALIIIFLCFLLIAIFDNSGIYFYQKAWRLLTIFMPEIFIIFITFFYTKSIKGFFSIYNTLIALFFIFCVYGFINYYTQLNGYNDFIARTYGTTNIADLTMAFGLERFRISSFTRNPVLYGLYLAIAILITFYLLYFSRVSNLVKYLYVGMLFLLASNLILVNTRTPIFALAVGLIIFIFWGLEFKQKSRVVLISIFLFVGMFSVSKTANEIITKTYDTFSGKKTEIEGSSFAMREIQLKGAIKVFEQNPITGNGFYYIANVLPNTVIPHFDYEDFYGFESYAYRVLIEEGILGIVGNIAFFGSLFIFFIKAFKRKAEIARKISLLSICLLITYLIFIFGTGDLASFPFFMAIMGINMKGVLLT